MKVAVVGAGAMGSLAAHVLVEAGAEVVVYETREDRLAYLASEGLHLKGGLEGRSRPEVRHPSEGGNPFDAFVMAVKAHATAETLRPLSPFVHRETVYLSLQEGNAWEVLGELVGRERTYLALAWVSAAEEEDGAVEVEECRTLMVGPALIGEEAIRTPGFTKLMEALRNGFPGRLTTISDPVKATLTRLRSAAPVSALCALMGAKPNELRERGEIGEWLEEAVVEGTRLAASLGLELPLLEDPWDDAVWDRLSPPMLRDVRAGGATERDHTTGFMLREASRCGVRTPLLSSLHSLLAEVEKGGRTPGEPLLREMRRRLSEERGMSLM